VQPDQFIDITPCYKAGSGLGAYVVGPVFPVMIHVSKSNAHNEEAAIRNRVLGDRQKPKEGAWAFAEQCMCQRLRSLKLHVKPWRMKRWFARYSGAQLIELQQSWDKWKSGLWSEKELRQNSCFVKREAALWLPYDEKEPIPRCIISCPPIVKPILGPWCVPAVQLLAEAFNYQNPLFYEIGATAEQVGVWFTHYLSKFGSKWLGKADYSKFDKNQSRDSITAEINCYKAMGLSGTRLRVMQIQAEKTSGVSHHGIYFKREAFKRSGVPNTTLGNTLVNMMAYVSYFDKIHAIPGRDYAVMVHGDDSIMFCSPEVVPGLKQHIADLGLKIKLEHGLSPYEIRYCSNIMYPVSGALPTISGDQATETKVGDQSESGEEHFDYLPGPTMKALLKMNFTVSRMRDSDNARKQHVRGVALGLKRMVSFIPLLRDMVAQMLIYTQGAHGKILEKAKAEIEYKYHRVEADYSSSIVDDSYLADIYHTTPHIIHGVRNVIGVMGERGMYEHPAIEEFVRCVAYVELTDGVLP